MNGLHQAQTLYDRRLPSDKQPSCERDREPAELTDAERGSALVCGTVEAALELRRANPGRLVIVSTVKQV